MPTTNIIRVEERIRRREEEKRLLERRKRDRELKMRRDMTRKSQFGQRGQKPIRKSLVPGMTKAQEFKKRYGK